MGKGGISEEEREREREVETAKQTLASASFLVSKGIIPIPLPSAY